jgi:hypothetical protein
MELTRPAVLVIVPADEAAVTAKHVSYFENGVTGLMILNTPIAIIAANTEPPCVHPTRINLFYVSNTCPQTKVDVHSCYEYTD